MIRVKNGSVNRACPECRARLRTMPADKDYVVAEWPVHCIKCLAKYSWGMLESKEEMNF